LTATYALDYGWRDLELEVRDDEVFAHDQYLARRKSVEALAEVVLDSTFHVVSYTEKLQRRKKLAVLAPTWGVPKVGDAARFLDRGYHEGGMVKIPRGAVLEDAFERVTRERSKYVRRPSGLDDSFYKVVF